jgi:hypothetical protein
MSRSLPPHRRAPGEHVGRGSAVEACATPGDAARVGGGCADRDVLCRMRSREAAVEARLSTRVGERALASAPARGPRRLTPKFSRMRRRRNSPPRQSLAPHVGCNATLGEAAARQQLTRGVSGWQRFLGSHCSTSEACPAAVRLGLGRKRALPLLSRLSVAARTWIRCSSRAARHDDVERRLSAVTRSRRAAAVDVNVAGRVTQLVRGDQVDGAGQPSLAAFKRRHRYSPSRTQRS